ncbi:helix-turn-helix domain-containing protein [Acidovorax sp. K2F]|nr:helix-turn-helix domain-containing protein [Acidovorax sp. K2F]MCT6719800.1 helix-turn-helix domain-containing protein [Acidovorax sp. K2F]
MFGTELLPSTMSVAYVAPRSFGSFLAELRRQRGFSQKTLARRAGIAASTLSEIENRRRIPPPQRAVIALGLALKATPEEQKRLISLADEARAGIGLRVGPKIPPHVAQLLRDLAVLGNRLSPAEARLLHLRAKELSMK